GNPGDLRGELGRALGEEPVKLLDGHAGGLAERPDGGPGALVLVLVAHEPDDLPVLPGELGDALGGGDLRGHLLAPLPGVGEEPFVVDGDFGARIGRGGHGVPPYRGDPAGAVAPVPAWCFPAAGIGLRTAGISRPGSSTCQYSQLKASLPRWFSRDWRSSGS